MYHLEFRRNCEITHNMENTSIIFPFSSLPKEKKNEKKKLYRNCDSCSSLSYQQNEKKVKTIICHFIVDGEEKTHLINILFYYSKLSRAFALLNYSNCQTNT